MHYISFNGRLFIDSSLVHSAFCLVFAYAFYFDFEFDFDFDLTGPYRTGLDSNGLELDLELAA